MDFILIIDNIMNNTFQLKQGNECYIPKFNYYLDLTFAPFKTHYWGDYPDYQFASRGWVCTTEGECQGLCDILNNAIKNIRR